MPQHKTHHYFFIIGILSLIIAIFLSFRAYYRIQQRPFPKLRENNVTLIQGWMTLDHISKVYLVPPSELEDRLGLDYENYKKISLTQIAKKLNKNPEDFIDEVKNAVSSFQKTHTKPPQL